MGKSVTLRIVAAAVAFSMGYGLVSLVRKASPVGTTEAAPVEYVPDAEDYRRFVGSVRIAHSRLFYHRVCSKAEQREACEEALRFAQTAKEAYDCVADADDSLSWLSPTAAEIVEAASIKANTLDHDYIKVNLLEWKANRMKEELSSNPNYWEDLAVEQDEFAGVEEDDTIEDLLKKGYNWGAIGRLATRHLRDNRMAVHEYFYLPSGKCRVE